MKNKPLLSEAEKKGNGINTIVVLWNESLTHSLLTGILEQLGYQLILIQDDLDIDSLESVSAEVVLFDTQSCCSLVEQRLKRLKELSSAPVLCMVDAIHPFSRSEIIFNSCDDFILKPFSPEELLMRIQWIAKRDHQKKTEEKGRPLAVPFQYVSSKSNDFQKIPYFTIDESARMVRIKGQHVHLTPKEYKLFCLLGSRVGQIFSNLEIIAELWPATQNATDKDVQQYIYSLRKKIEQDASKPRFLINVPGFGYKLAEIEGAGETAG